jgi:hypothetical protein
MQAKIKIHYPVLLFSFLYILGIYFFYITYVPLVPRFQYALGPILILVAGTTIVNIKAGGLCFVCLFPLINSLPYFFGIYETTPHAPTALVLFLALLCGVLLRTAFFEEKFDLPLRLFRPILLAFCLVLISGIVTFFRYANFYPFLSDSIYELTTNTYGVSAGGAMMSVVFSSLNYITGFIFFFLVVSQLNSIHSINRFFSALGISTVLAISFGLVQKIFNLSVGKNLLNIEMKVVNGTFKDSVSFGTFLAMIIPLMMGACFSFKRGKRLLSLIGLGAAFYLLFYTGSKIALVSAFVSLLFFVLFGLHILRRKKIALVMSLLLVMIIALFFVLSRYGTLAKSVTVARTEEMFGRGVLNFLSDRRGTQWKSAVSMTRDYPLSGVGVGAYIIELPNYAKKYRRRAPDSAENYFLQVASEMGITGSVFFLWILGLVGYLALKRLWKRSRDGDSPFLQIGVLLGIGVYYAHLFFHTYIGSYEIKYFFWLLVALAFFGDPNGGREKQAAPLPKNVKIVFAVLLILFTGVHLWNSTHSLSLSQRTKDLELKHRFGFYPAEQTPSGVEFRWSKKAAGLSVTVEKPVLAFSLHASHPDIVSSPVQVKVSLVKNVFREKKLLEKVTLRDSGWRSLSFNIPEELHTSPILFIEVDRVWNPHKALGTDDNRYIGVALANIRWISDHQQIP